MHCRHYFPMRPGLTEQSYSCRSESIQSQGSDGVGMKLTDVRSPAWRARAVARVEKKVLGFTRRSHAKSPVFIVGLQRSGTTMLMNIFHLHPETQVFDEARSSKVFLDFRIRGIDTLRRIIDDSHYEFPCFKIIARQPHPAFASSTAWRMPVCCGCIASRGPMRPRG